MGVVLPSHAPPSTTVTRCSPSSPTTGTDSRGGLIDPRPGKGKHARGAEDESTSHLFCEYTYTSFFLTLLSFVLSYRDVLFGSILFDKHFFNILFTQMYE